MSEQPDALVGNPAELCTALDVPDVQSVGDIVDGYVDCGVCHVVVTDAQVEIQLDVRGFALVFPFRLSEFWDAIDDVESELFVLMACNSLAEQIGDTEGVSIELSVDFTSGEPRWVDLARNLTDSYRYAEKAPDDMTVDEWLTTRVQPGVPGLCVTLAEDVSGGDTLGSLRDSTARPRRRAPRAAG